MIISTLAPDYDNRCSHLTCSSFDVKYLYPWQHGYHKTESPYPAVIPAPSVQQLPFPTGLEGLLYQRQEIIHSKIQLLLSEITQRRILKDQNLYHIDVDQCACRNIIYLIGSHYLDRRRVDIERKIIDLEQEKRREKSDYFRDILFLRKELRESLIEKLEEDQKTEVFMNMPEESLCPT